MFRSAVHVRKSFSSRRLQSTIQQGFPAVGLKETLPEGDVKDMSVHGLCLSSIKIFFYGLLSNSKSTSIVPALGRWKIGVDNFGKGKSYDYDHSA